MYDLPCCSFCSPTTGRSSILGLAPNSRISSFRQQHRHTGSLQLAIQHDFNVRRMSRSQRGPMIQAFRESSSVSETMTDLRVKGKGAFIPFIMAGDPDLATTEKALQILDEAGADVIELGCPYSDPLADGPTIQMSSTRGLDSGATLDKVLDLVARVSPKLRAPIILFQYYNPILRKGPDEYCRAAKEAGAAGILVPDLCLEETEVMQQATRKAGLELTLLVTPTTPQDRMKRIAAVSEGFVYLVSVTGVTGGRAENQARVEGLIGLLREVTDNTKSVAVGFGVSGPKQAQQLRGWGAEGVIVGSALVRALGEAETPEKGLDKLKELATSIRAAI